MPIRWSIKNSFFLAWACFFFTIAPLFSERKEEIKLQADSIFYQKDTGITTLKGQAEIETKEWKAESDEAEIWDQENFFILSGSCKLSSKEKPFSLKGAYFEFDRERKEGFGFQTEGKYDPFLFQAEAISFTEKKSRLTGASLTTCSGKVPNYKVTGKDLEYFPQEKVIGRHVTVYGKEKKIFYFPWYYLNLKEKQPFAPDFGRNDVDGFYFRTVVPYLLSPALPGYLFFDWLQKKGVSSGFQQDYFFWKDAKLSFSLRGTQNRQRTATSLLSNIKLENPLAGGKTELSFERANTINTSLAEVLSDTGSLRYQYRTKARESLLEMRYNRTGTSPKTSQLRLISSEKIFFRSRQSFSLFHDIYENKSTGAQADWEGQSRLTWEAFLKDWKWQVLTERRLDLDGKHFQGDRDFPSFDVLPEISFQSPLFPQWYLPAVTFSLGHYQEKPKKVEASRFTWDLSKSYSKPLSSSLTPGVVLTYQQSFYDQGSAKYRFSLNPSLKIKPQRFLTFTTSYFLTKSKGHSPFLKDRTGDFLQKNIAYSTEYIRKSYQLRLTTSRDLLARQWALLVVENRFLPDSSSEIGLRTEYDLNRGEPGNLNFSYRRQKKDLQAEANFLYNLKEGKLLNVQEKTSFPLGRWYRLETAVQYLPPSRTFITKDFQLIRYLDCLEASLSYRPVRKEIAFQIYLTAFPTRKIGIGIDERGTSLQQLPF